MTMRKRLWGGKREEKDALFIGDITQLMHGAHTHRLIILVHNVDLEQLSRTAGHNRVKVMDGQSQGVRGASLEVECLGHCDLTHRVVLQAEHAVLVAAW